MIKNHLGETFYVTNENFQPITVKKEDVTYFEPTQVTKTGVDLTFANTYNHHCDEIKVYGDYEKIIKREAVLENYMVQFENHKGDYMTITSPVDCEIVRCGRNLLNLDTELNWFPSASGTVITDTATSAVVFPSTGKMALYLTDFSYINQGSIRYALSENEIEIGSSISRRDISYSVVVDNKNKNSLFSISMYGTGHDINDLLGSQFELGDTFHDYEPYVENRYTLTAHTPLQVPVLDGVNTIYATSSGVLLNVKYEKADSEEDEDTDINTVVSIKCVKGTLASSMGDLNSSLDVPNLYAVYENGEIVAQDILYVNGNTGEMVIQKSVDSSENFSPQVLETPVEVELTYDNLSTYPHQTNIVYTEDENTLAPVVSVKLSQYAI